MHGLRMNHYESCGICHSHPCRCPKKVKPLKPHQLNREWQRQKQGANTIMRLLVEKLRIADEETNNPAKTGLLDEVVKLAIEAAQSHFFLACAERAINEEHEKLREDMR